MAGTIECAAAILKRHRKALDEIAEMLLERETLNAEDLPKIAAEPEPEGAEAAQLGGPYANPRGLPVPLGHGAAAA